MDYSQVHDPDHPAGTSPWNSSPRQSTHPTFGAPIDAPPSPLSGIAAVTRRTSQDISREQEEFKGEHQEGPNRTGPASFSDNQETVDDVNNVRRSAGVAEGGPKLEGQNQQIHQSSRESGQQPQVESHSRPARYQGGTRGQRNASQYKVQAKITGLERTGRKDPILRFDVHFRDVRRTHSEFIKLAEHLISSNPEAFVPAVPLAVTSAGAGTDEDEARVKGSMQRWLNYVCSNDVLMRDDEMIFFVESDFGYSPVIRMKQPATGVRRKMIKQLAPPPDDTPELFDARPVVKSFYLGTMDTGQKVDKIVKSRRGLGLAESDLGIKISQMHVQEIHPGLANAYRKLGRTIQAIGDYHAAQGTAEATTLADPLNYHSNDALIVKETLTNRHILLRDLLSAQAATRSKLSAADRIKSSTSVRREKVDEAISALDEAKSHEQYLGQKCQRVTANLLLEKRRWFNRTAEDLRASIREYVLRAIEAERRALATLESVRPDVRAIDASGGLSRLGRETHPTTRRASMASSQGPKGDAWSGVQRRGDALSRSVSGGFGSSAPLPEQGEDENGTSSKKSSSTVGRVKEEDDMDKVDARNAASRLATSTF